LKTARILASHWLRLPSFLGALALVVGLGLPAPTPSVAADCHHLKPNGQRCITPESAKEDKDGVTWYFRNGCQKNIWVCAVKSDGHTGCTVVRGGGQDSLECSRVGKACDFEGWFEKDCEGLESGSRRSNSGRRAGSSAGQGSGGASHGGGGGGEFDNRQTITGRPAPWHKKPYILHRASDCYVEFKTCIAKCSTIENYRMRIEVACEEACGRRLCWGTY
jgi:hypothetical protein